MNLKLNCVDPDQTAWMCHLIWIYTVIGLVLVAHRIKDPIHSKATVTVVQADLNLHCLLIHVG
jgi:hypothetical protein